jgi:hypothetical protein
MKSCLDTESFLSSQFEQAQEHSSNPDTLTLRFSHWNFRQILRWTVVTVSQTSAFPIYLVIFNARGTHQRRYSGQGQMRISNQTRARASENSSPRYVEKVPFVTGNPQK